VSAIYGHGNPPLSDYPSDFFSPSHCNVVIFQAASAVSASQSALADLFERIENVFRRLETYIEVPPTTGMMDSIVKVMAEVLCILAIATKEIKQNRTSQLTLWR
jgi:hypothetical protein